MRLPEQRLWDAFRRQISKHPGIRAERIENLVAEGTPDVLLQSSMTFLVELKSAPGPVRDGTPVFGAKYGLNDDQVNWHLEWAHFGGRSFILVKDRRRSKHYLVDGARADLFNGVSTNELHQLSIVIGWEAIMAFLS